VYIHIVKYNMFKLSNIYFGLSLRSGLFTELQTASKTLMMTLMITSLDNNIPFFCYHTERFNCTNNGQSTHTQNSS